MFIGNQSIRNHFEKLIKNDSFGHAYLFHGPEGVGKRSFTLALTDEICGNIPGKPDLKVIDPERNREGPQRASASYGVDKAGDQVLISDIRELRDFIYLTPFGKHKAVVINNAHNLTQDASNALLKVLEEPPGKSVIFLISHLPQQIPETVISRCQAWRFKPIKKEEIRNYLTAQRKSGKETISLISKLAGGSLAKALELANDFEGFKKNINLLEKLAKADFVSRFETAKSIASEGEALKKRVGDWLVWSATSNKLLAGKLLRLTNTISKPQFNHRLALENFLVNL